MRMMYCRWLPALCCGMTVLTVLNADDITSSETTAAQVLVLRPLPASADGDFVPELDPRLQWPRGGQFVRVGPGDALSWSTVSPNDDDEGDISYTAVYLDVSRFMNVEFTIEGAGELRLWIDGASAGTGEAKLTHTADLTRGLHRVLVRDSGGSIANIAAKAQHDAVLEFRTHQRHPPTDYEAFRGVPTLSNLSLSPDGQTIAVTVTERDLDGDGSQSSLHLLSRDGVLWFERPSAKLVTWSADSLAALIRENNDLLIWEFYGTPRIVLDDEPDLGDVAMSRDGSFVVFSSTRGAPEDESTGPRRSTEIRERLSDWPTRPHLHLLDLRSGVRRRLTETGDWVQDAFAISSDGRRLVYLRNVPIDERPWFATDVISLNLVTSEENVLGRMVMGFEGRPGLEGLALAPDGNTLALIGPPRELGRFGEGPEPNVYDPDLWLVSLEPFAIQNVTETRPLAAHGPIAWSDDSQTVYFLGNVGPEQSPHRIDLSRDEPVIERISTDREVTHEFVVDSRGRQLVWIGSGPAEPPALFVQEQEHPIFDPSHKWLERMLLPTPERFVIEAEDGFEIDAWLFRPVDAHGDEKLPVVLYYYGGATPTLLAWDERPQFITAHGYASLIINSRGAAGYAGEYSSSHVSDWGPRSGGDILHALDEVLEANPDLDADRVGCYGASYGGFMTMWLLGETDRFKAAAAMYGVSDLSSYQGQGMWGWTYNDQAMAEHFPWSDPEFYAEHSPFRRADRITTPLLLLHGERDENVPYGESVQMFGALRTLGQPVEMVLFPDEGHGLRSKWSNRVQHRTMLVEWFDRWLRDQPEAWEARWE